MNKGFSTLFVVIILGSASLALGLWLSTGSYWSLAGSNNDVRSAQAKALANACAETALGNMQANNSYTGNGNLTLNGNTCSYVVSNTGGNSRLITVTGTVGIVVRKLQISTTAFNPLTTSSWQDI